MLAWCFHFSKLFSFSSRGSGVLSSFLRVKKLATVGHTTECSVLNFPEISYIFKSGAWSFSLLQRKLSVSFIEFTNLGQLTMLMMFDCFILSLCKSASLLSIIFLFTCIIASSHSSTLLQIKSRFSNIVFTFTLTECFNKWLTVFRPRNIIQKWQLTNYS